MNAAAARDLAGHSGVLRVSLNAKVRSESLDPKQLATSFNASTRTPSLWEKDATGRGVGVAVLDTGIAGDLPDFGTSAQDPTSRVIASVVTNPDATTAGDGYGHGTHVAGLIAGNSDHRPASDPLRGRYAGTAPDANLINVKVSDDHGASTVLDVIYGLQFAVDHKDELGIRVVNLSLRSASAQSYRDDPLDAAVEQAWFKGLVVVAAAGNSGTADDAVSHAPGNDPYAITVGAVDDQGTKDIRTTCWPRGPAAASPRTAWPSRRSPPRARAWCRPWPLAATTRRCARPASPTASTSASAGRRWPPPSCPASPPT
jgi:serine protease AprX